MSRAVVWAVLISLCWSTVAEAKRVSVTVFLLPGEDSTQQLVSRVAGSLQQALKANPRLEVKDSDQLLVEYSGEVPTDQITKAREALEAGIALLRSAKAAEAIPQLEQAVTLHQEVMAFVKKELLARSFLALGVAQAEARQSRRAYSTFVQLLVWRPELTYDTETFDPAHLPLFQKAKAAVRKLRRGSVELITDPPGARAYVDGKFKDITPTTAFGLPVGRHYATYKQPGYIKAVQPIEVSPTEQNSYTLKLKRSEKFLLLQQALEGAKRTLGQPVASPDMASLNTFLFIDQVIFATLQDAPHGKTTVRAYLYDLRSKLRLNQVTLTTESNALAEISALAQNLYLNVRYDGQLEAPPEPPPPPPEKRKRFYTQWWFWTAVGVGIAGVVIPLAAAWPESKRCEAGNFCISIAN